MSVIGVFCKEPEVVKKIEQLDFLYDTTDFLILDGSSVQESIQIAEAIWNITPSSAIIGIAKQLEDIFALLPFLFLFL